MGAAHLPLRDLLQQISREGPKKRPESHQSERQWALNASLSPARPGKPQRPAAARDRCGRDARLDPSSKLPMSRRDRAGGLPETETVAFGACPRESMTN